MRISAELEEILRGIAEVWVALLSFCSCWRLKLSRKVLAMNEPLHRGHSSFYDAQCVRLEAEDLKWWGRKTRWVI